MEQTTCFKTYFNFVLWKEKIEEQKGGEKWGTMEGSEEVNKDKNQGKKQGKWTHEEEEKEYTDTLRK